MWSSELHVETGRREWLGCSDTVDTMRGEGQLQTMATMGHNQIVLTYIAHTTPAICLN